MINDLIFTIILFLLLLFISLEDIKSLLISNKNLTILAVTGFTYAFINGLQNTENNTLPTNLIV